MNIVEDIHCPMLFSIRAGSQYCQSTLIPDASSVVLVTVNSEGGAWISAESGRYKMRGLPMASLITDTGREHGA